MRYRIEFLKETTEENAVCQIRDPLDVELSTARLQAILWGASAREDLGATGFQIRDLRHEGCIVTLEDFNEPPPTVH